MGKVVTVMNMKGGVGKTTVSMHLAAASAQWAFEEKAPRKVLVIDYDPQFNLSQSLLSPKTYYALEGKGQTILSVLIEDEDNLDPYHLQVPGNQNPPSVADIATRVHTASKNRYLDLVPSTLDLMYVALGQADGSMKPLEERFSKFLEECKKSYDLVIIDCHPAGSLFTKTSLRNSDYVVIPVMPQKYAVRGIGLMMTFIEAKKQGAKGPEPIILFNCVPRIGVAKEEASIRADAKYGPLCMVNSLKKYSAFSEPEHGSGFAWQSKKAYSGEASFNIYRVCKEFLGKVGLINDAK